MYPPAWGGRGITHGPRLQHGARTSPAGSVGVAPGEPSAGPGPGCRSPAAVSRGENGVTPARRQRHWPDSGCLPSLCPPPPPSCVPLPAASPGPAARELPSCSWRREEEEAGGSIHATRSCPSAPTALWHCRSDTPLSLRGSSWELGDCVASLWTHSWGGRGLARPLARARGARPTLQPSAPETPAHAAPAGPEPGAQWWRRSSGNKGGDEVGTRRPQLAWGSEPRGLLARLRGHVLSWGVTSASAGPRGTRREPAPGPPAGPCPLKRPVLLWNVLLVGPGLPGPSHTLPIKAGRLPPAPCRLRQPGPEARAPSHVQSAGQGQEGQQAGPKPGRPAAPHSAGAADAGTGAPWGHQGRSLPKGGPHLPPPKAAPGLSSEVPRA